MYRRILLISPEPYRTDSSSRCLDSFFGNWSGECIAQIYTSDIKPGPGFCKNYFRVTDADMLFSITRGKNAGKVVSVDLSICENKSQTVKHRDIVHRVKAIFKKKNAIYHLLRMFLWHKKRWNNPEFNKWLDAFNPEIIFLDLGQDNILANIALTVSEKYNIPFVTFLPDDFYFNKDEKKGSIFNQFYVRLLKNKTESVLKKSSYNIFSCDMMRNKYCNYFGIVGEVLYFTSHIIPHEYNTREKDRFAYLGSFEYGRWRSLVDIGNNLSEIDDNLYIDVYGFSDNKDILKAFELCKGIHYHGAVPYSTVIEIMNKVEYVVHVEDFDERSKKYTKYSLSTKIADCLMSGACVFAYGPQDVGSIDYLIKTDAAIVCTNQAELRRVLSNSINDLEFKVKITERAKIVAQKNHSVCENQKKMKSIVDKIVLTNDLYGENSNENITNKQ